MRRLGWLALLSLLAPNRATGREEPPPARASDATAKSADPPEKGSIDELRKRLSQVRARLAQPAGEHAKDCADLTGIWYQLPASLDPSHPLFELHRSVRTRLLQRRRDQRCLVSGQGHTPGPTPNEQYRAYLGLLKSVEAKREKCAALECPDLTEEEEELARQAVHLVRVLPPASAERLEIESTLDVVFGAGLSNRALVDLLHGRALTSEEEKLLVRSLASKDPGLAAKVLGVMAGLEGQSLSEEQATELALSLTKLFAMHGHDADRLVRNATIARLLAEPEKSKVLHLVLQILADRYPEFQKDALQAMAKLRRAEPAEALVASFFDKVDPIILAQIEREALALDALPREPADALPYTASASPVLVYFSGDAAGECRSGEAFLSKVVRTLHFRRGPNSGLQPWVEVPDAPTLAALKRDLPRVLAEGKRFPACQQAAGPYEPLCRPPIPGVFLFEVTTRNGQVEAVARWWERAGAVWKSQSLLPQKFRADCGLEEESAGLRVARTLMRRASLFKQVERDEPPEVRRVFASSSPWSAALFAGAPYLADGRATPASRWTFSLLDGLFTAGVVTSTALSIHYRNEAAGSPRGSMEAANDALTATYLFAGGIVATRLVSGLLYELAPGAWQASETRGTPK